MNRSLFKRILLMVIGLFISSLGVSFSIKAELGTSPIACCPAVYALPLGVSVGTAMILLCVLTLIVQIIILRRSFQPVQFLQLVLGFLFGSQTDLTTILLSGVPADTLALRILYCALGIVILAFGIYLLLAADLLMLSPDAMLTVISKKSGIEYGKLKIAMDIVPVGVSVIGGLVFYRRIVHIGPGTLAATILVGSFVRLFKRVRTMNSALTVFLS